MTDRVVKVSLVAQVNGYIQGMAQARKATSDLSDEAKKKLEAQKNVMEGVGKASLAMGAVAAAGVAIAIKKFADFDAQMSQVKSLSHATADEMKGLTDAALTMGQNIGFSATQVADAETELVKAGVGVSDMLGGSLVGALNLAAAGQIDVGKATQIAAVAMTQFKLAGKDVPHLADLLAAGADKALGGVDQLGDALNQGGLVASQFGLTIDETVGTLSAFANAGLLGSDAGTSFKQMLLSLANPSKQSKQLMEDLGIAAYNANGQFVGITNLAGQLQSKLGKLTAAQRDAALSTIFGSDAIRTANVLYKEGSAGIDKWVKAVDDTGFAAEQARGKMDNLQGDLKKLGAVIDSTLIKQGSSANGPLRELAQTAEGLVSAFGDLPGPVQQTAFVLTAATAAIGLTGGAALVAVPKVMNFADVLERVGNTRMASALTGVTSFLTGPWGIALGVGAGVLGGAFLQSVADAQAKVDAFTESLDKNTGAITDNTKTAAAKQLKESGAFDVAKRLGIDLGDLTSASIGDPEAIAKVNAQMDAYTAKIAELQKKTQKGVFDPNSDAAKTATDVLRLNEILGNTQDSLGKSQQDFIDNAKATAELAGATDSYNRALSEANASIQQNGATLDQSTAAGQANQQALDALVQSSLDVINATAAQGASQDKINATYAAQRQQLLGVAAQMGLTGQAADDYVNGHLGKIPRQIDTQVNVNTQAALNNIAAVNRAYADLQARMNAGQDVIVRPGGPMVARAAGGILPGTPSTRDNMLIHAASGEFVVNALATAANRPLLEAINAGQRPLIYAATNHYANGGLIGSQPSVAVTYVPAATYAPTQTVVLPPAEVSLAGATLHATIDGQPIQIMIADQIVQNERHHARRARMG